MTDALTFSKLDADRILRRAAEIEGGVIVLRPVRHEHARR